MGRRTALSAAAGAVTTAAFAATLAATTTAAAVAGDEGINEALQTYRFLARRK